MIVASCRGAEGVSPERKFQGIVDQIEGREYLCRCHGNKALNQSLQPFDYIEVSFLCWVGPTTRKLCDKFGSDQKVKQALSNEKIELLVYLHSIYAQ
jgi:hypothetical protein